MVVQLLLEFLVNNVVVLRSSWIPLFKRPSQDLKQALAFLDMVEDFGLQLRVPKNERPQLHWILNQRFEKRLACSIIVLEVLEEVLRVTTSKSFHYPCFMTLEQVAPSKILNAEAPSFPSSNDLYLIALSIFAFESIKILKDFLDIHLFMRFIIWINVSQNCKHHRIVLLQPSLLL